MPTTPSIVNRAGELSKTESARIDHSLEALGKRLTNFTNPVVELVLDKSPHMPGSIDVHLRVALGVRDTTLRSKQTSRTADHAVKLACDDIKRQLERTVADLRGEGSYGIPSRRDPEHLRPANQTDVSGEDAELWEDETFDEGDERNSEAWVQG